MGSCVLGVEESAARPQDLPSRLQAGVAVSPDRGFPNMLLGRGLAWLAAEAPQGGSETLGVRKNRCRACSRCSAASTAQDSSGPPETALRPDLRG